MAQGHRSIAVYHRGNTVTIKTTEVVDKIFFSALKHTDGDRNLADRVKFEGRK